MANRAVRQQPTPEVRYVGDNLELAARFAAEQQTSHAAGEELLAEDDTDRT